MPGAPVLLDASAAGMYIGLRHFLLREAYPDPARPSSGLGCSLWAPITHSQHRLDQEALR